MKNSRQLPLTDPVYTSVQFQAASAAIADNPSIRNWYLNNTMILNCQTRFLYGYSSPLIYVRWTNIVDNPCFDRITIDTKYLGNNFHYTIKSLIDDGYYIYFKYLDDYYLTGKSWYKKRHFSHDGVFYGYDDNDKTYSVYAYNQDWLLKGFKVEQRLFTLARTSIIKRENKYCVLVGFKPKTEEYKLIPSTILFNLRRYLDSDIKKYPPEVEGEVDGIVVHEYLMMFIDMLYEDKIPYEKTDWRVFRFLWDHKKIMLERIIAVEKELVFDNSISKKYESVYKESNNIRMLYASYTKRRRNSLLMSIKEKLQFIYEQELILLPELIKKMERVLEK